MSQEPPSQPPLSPKPGADQSETTQKTGNQFQEVLKTQSIKVLRGTIQVLEGVLVKLEAEPPAGTLPPATTKEPSLNKLQMGWSAVLARIRSVLPENLSSKLPDIALTGIIAGIAVIVVWTSSALLPDKPSEVANVPSSEPVPTANETTPPEPVPTANVTTPPEPMPTANETTPPELTAPAEPQPIEIAPPPPEPVPTPTPTLELTPEQNLIASIENQVAEITDRYADGLIQSIQANFQGSRLAIKVGDDWYNLKPSQQDKLAAQMLERAREFDFSHLEITDPEGTLLARSPVVGTDMVILKRQVQERQQSA